LPEGSLNGAELIDRMELLNLGPLRIAGAQLSAVIEEGMLLPGFISACLSRLPKAPIVLHFTVDKP